MPLCTLIHQIIPNLKVTNQLDMLNCLQTNEFFALSKGIQYADT